MGLLDGLLERMMQQGMGGTGSMGAPGGMGGANSMGGLGGLGSLLGGMGGGSGMGGMGAQGGGGALLSLAMVVLQQSGGIEGLLAKLQSAGHGSTGQSWVGTGANQPIDPDDLTQALGHGNLGALAQSVGIPPQDAAGGLAKVLPEVVDHMTPNGQVPANSNDMIAEVLSMLQRRA